MKKYLFISSAFLLLILLMPINAAEKSSAPENAQLYFISPQNGEEVLNPVRVIFGLNGMGIAPAGIKFENTGHHHLLIDLTELPDIHAPIPSDNNHMHFGKGQTEALINLKPGDHTLQLILGDHMHIPHDPAVVSNKIKITVKN